MPSVFISYSRKDEKEKDELLAHLRVLGQAVEVWSDDRIDAGTDWRKEIDLAMDQAQVAILLITVNFLNSNFILNQEVPRLLERHRKNEGMTVLPVIARHCAWQSVPWLTRLNVRPRNANPVWRQQGIHAEEELAIIANEVARIVKGHRPKSSTPSLDDKILVKPAAGISGNDEREKRQPDYKHWGVGLVVLVLTCLIGLGLSKLSNWLDVDLTTPTLIASISSPKALTSLLQETPTLPVEKTPTSGDSPRLTPTLIPPPTATHTSVSPTLTPTHTPVPLMNTPAPPTPTDTPLPPTSTAISTSTPTLTPRPVRIREVDGMTMLYVPAGTFPMGSGDNDPMGQVSEKPQHLVTLTAFWIDRTEVTNAQYEHCVVAGVCAASSSANDPDFNGADHPVVNVSWQDAMDYCAWAGGRLLTEAEWEYAARGPEGSIFPWGEVFDGSKLNAYETGDSYAYTAPVGSFPEGASWVGTLDMAGNADEWVNDWYAEDYYASSPAENPKGPENGEKRILRGGSWGGVGIAETLRTAYRFYGDPLYRNSNFGIRCAASPGS